MGDDKTSNVAQGSNQASSGESARESADVAPSRRKSGSRPPTIDLKASRVSETSTPPSTTPPSTESESAKTQDHNEDHNGAKRLSWRERIRAASLPLWISSRISSISSLLVPAAIGALVSALVLGAAWLADGQSRPPSVASTQILSPPSDKSALDAFSARLDALEKTMGLLRDELEAIRNHGEQLAVNLNEIKSASPDMGVIEERLGKIERATAALAAERSATGISAAEDARLKRVAAATLLDSRVHQGEPYAAALAAAKLFFDDAATFKPLEVFAASGVPTASALSRELLTLLPRLALKPETPPAGAGLLERLQQSALSLVRIQRIDDAAAGDSAVARARVAAQRDDLAGAKQELNSLPVNDRAIVQSWIDRVNARDEALAASRQFAADAMMALSKPAR